jgi:hypothetical protein
MSTGEVVSEHLTAHRFALMLSESNWERLVGSVLQFWVAELFSCDFQIILHFADVRGEQTQVWNVNQITRINCHTVDMDDDGTSETIMDAKTWLNWNGNLDNANNSNDICTADGKSDIEQDTGIKDLKSAGQWDMMNAKENVPGLIWPIRQSKSQTEQVLAMVNALEMMINKGVKK